MASIINVSRYSATLFVSLILCNNDFFLADINKRVFADMQGIIKLVIQIVKTFNANEDNGVIKKAISNFIKRSSQYAKNKI